MFKLSDNYFQRKCYLKREEVPTQSIMRMKMNPPLAEVYFKSMTYRLKVLAGLEPPMKGGGSDWYVPPTELLDGRAVLKPMKKEYLSQLGFIGIDHIGERIVAKHHRSMAQEKTKALIDSDANWKDRVIASCHLQWEMASKEAAKQNTDKIKNAFQEFSEMYSSSLNKIEEILCDGTVNEIKRYKEKSYQEMLRLFEIYVKQQATTLYVIYTEKYNTEKDKQKARFIEIVEQARTHMCERLHDINVEKHTAIEKIRKYMECQNLACRIYVALKEREECQKEMTLSEQKHKKEAKLLKEQIELKDFEILLAKEKEKKREEFNRVWQRKVCEVVKRFQMFVSYCLSSLPDHAEFFLNMEKLMLLQLNEAIENPSAESIIVAEEEKFHTPVPRPHPFFLFCDKGYKPYIDQKLCPKHCTSSASQLPVIIVNKRCIYAACDNFEMFTNKITQYIHGKRGDDADFHDDHSYTHDVPVKFTPSKQLEDLKLEGSLLKILQREHPNLKGVQTECCVCRIPHCFCSRLLARKLSEEIPEAKRETSLHSIPSGNKIVSREIELEHEREPKWESYMDHVKPKRCSCPKTAKKHLQEHLPAYMRNTSIFETPELPNYEVCSLDTLKRLVRKAQGKRLSPKPVVVESKTRDISTQYSEQEFDYLCTCFSEEEVEELIRNLLKESRPGDFKVVDGSISPTYLEKASTSFATDRAYSLKNLVTTSPELEEIFRKADCNF